jgi:mercuric ion binding protein
VAGRAFHLEGILISLEKILPMKNLLMFVVLLAGTVSVGFGQAKKGLQTVTISTPTVQCEMCKQRIEKYMVREEGVTKVNVDYKKKQAKVTFYAERTNIENIKTAIANAGYDADDVTANEEAYEKLPKCCKKPETAETSK